jgi:hypothetical protein
MGEEAPDEVGETGTEAGSSAEGEPGAEPTGEPARRVFWTMGRPRSLARRPMRFSEEMLATAFRFIVEKEAPRW